jgi:aminomuconate-semialdehyde/2-hydroxymuconate-6-semialdehyde dehydrogenase
VLSYYAKAEAGRRRVVTGGGVPSHAGVRYSEGSFVRADDLDRLCSETAAVMREEIFGPCCHIAPFDEEDAVIALANDTDYGLATTDLDREPRPRAPRRQAQVEVGICWVNSWFLRDLRTAVRRREGLGHRPRGRRAFAGVLHRAPQRLRQALRPPRFPL